eukprot:6900050-Prymnesium_polylepis.1
MPRLRPACRRCSRTSRGPSLIETRPSLGGDQRTPFPANDRAMASEGLQAPFLYALCEGCSCESDRRAVGSLETAHLHAAGPISGRPGCSTSACIRVGAAIPVASAEPVSIEQNLSCDLLDGGAEPHHLTGDAGNREPVGVWTGAGT